LGDTADITIGDFLMNDPALSFLCDPFKIQVKLALGLQYQPFQDEIQCSFTSALGNATSAMSSFLGGDFVGGGGWDSWLQMTTVPQNNQMGAMLLAQGELDARLEANTENAKLEANWGGGFLSWKDCTTNTTATGTTNFSNSNVNSASVVGNGVTSYTDAASGRFVGNTAYDNSRVNYYNSSGTVVGATQTNQDCTIKTPGSAIASIIPYFSTQSLQQAGIAQDLNEIVNALVNKILDKGMDMLSSGGLLGSSSSQNTSVTSAAYSQEVTDYLAALASSTNSTTGNISNSYYNSDGTINFSQTFANQALALEAINSQISIENQYLSAQNNIYKLLDDTQNAFTSSACSASTDIVNQITGNYTGVKDLPWNKKDVALATTTANSNLTALSATADAVTAATDDSTVPSLVQNLPKTFHSSLSAISYSTGDAFLQIKTWLAGKVTTYKTACNITNQSLLSELGVQ
jgi:hypothetical protein